MTAPDPLLRYFLLGGMAMLVYTLLVFAAGVAIGLTLFR